jgi:UDP-glucuronate decarboxylase
MTIKDLAKLIIKLTNSKSTLIYQDLPQDDPIRRRPDISLAKKELEWSPIVGIEEGLLKTIDYFKAII